MKVRMIYAYNLVLGNGKEPRRLKADEEHDLDAATAAELIAKGIAEPFPPRTAKSDKEDKK